MWGSGWSGPALCSGAFVQFTHALAGYASGSTGGGPLIKPINTRSGQEYRVGSVSHEGGGGWGRGAAVVHFEEGRRPYRSPRKSNPWLNQKSQERAPFHISSVANLYQFQA